LLILSDRILTELGHTYSKGLSSFFRASVTKSKLSVEFSNNFITKLLKITNTVDRASSTGIFIIIIYFYFFLLHLGSYYYQHYFYNRSYEYKKLNKVFSDRHISEYALFAEKFSLLMTTQGVSLNHVDFGDYLSVLVSILCFSATC
jgi:hypothetical protein